MSVRRGFLLPVLFHLLLVPVSSQSFEELATRLEAVDPDAPGSGDILLETLRRAPDVETARRYYSQYADLLSNPRQEVAGFRWLGTLEELVGNYQGALDAFEALLELEPEDDRIRLRAAAAALETGDYRRARGHAQFVIDSARNREAQREAGLYLALSHFF
ncbi:MAG: tetratricopeptide repeat protein, partial [Alkalispirochaetaceae bacterium]